MENYAYEMNDDETRLTVRTALNAVVARMHWPATEAVSRQACLLVGRPVRCTPVEPSGDTEGVYTVSEETRPAYIADANYRVAAARQGAIENQLVRERSLDDDTPTFRIYTESAEWRAASAETKRAYEALEQHDD